MGGVNHVVPVGTLSRYGVTVRSATPGPRWASAKPATALGGRCVVVRPPLSRPRGWARAFSVTRRWQERETHG